MSNERVSDERLVEILARVSPPAEGWSAGLPTMDVASIITELQALRSSFPQKDEVEPQQEEAVADHSDQAAIEIADAVIAWMVKYDLLDADLEYRDDDIIEVLDDLAPTPVQKVQESQTVSEEMVERACRSMHPLWDTAMTPGDQEWHRKYMRMALTAALEPSHVR